MLWRHREIMMAREVACIYCPERADATRGEGDHVIPRALGEFRKDKRFRRICQACNNALSPCEEELLRCGPERLCRQLVLGTRSKRKGSGGNWAVGAGGTPPPKISINYEGMVMPAVHRAGMDAVETYEHMVVYDEDEERHVIKLFPQMSPEAIKARFDAFKIGEVTKTTMHCDEVHLDTYKALISQAFSSDIEYIEHSTMEPGLQVIPTNFTFTCTVRYFRAIAKIAFHYYLTHNRRGLHGDEDCFAPIRAFIRHGVGDKDEFFPEARVFGDAPSMAGMAPSRWGHILAAYEHKSSMIGYVRLFYGPGGRTMDYHVALGELQVALLSDLSWQHSFVYDDPIAATGPVGQAYPCTPRRLR